MYSITCIDKNNDDIILLLDEKKGEKLCNNELKCIGKIILKIINKKMGLNNEKIPPINFKYDHILLNNKITDQYINNIKKYLSYICNKIIVVQIVKNGININHRPLHIYMVNNIIYIKYTKLGEQNNIDTLYNTLENVLLDVV
jgi:hypothetical protein